MNNKIKKILIISLISLYASGSLSAVCALEDVFKGHIEEQNSTEKEKNKLYTGSIDKLDHNDILKMTVSKVLDANNSKENDEFFAEVTDDIEAKDGILIPRGTIAHGYVKRVSNAKNFSRNGLLYLHFDCLITPDGQEIPIKGTMSTRLHPIKAASEAIVYNLAYTTAGGAAGGLLALSFAGVAGTVSSQGCIIAGGAAIGGSAGLAMALSHKGKDVAISPGDEILVKISTTTQLPVYKKTAFPQQELKTKELEVKINDINYKKDSYGQVNKMVLSLFILNKTGYDFSVSDIALLNAAGTAYYPDTFDTERPFSEIKSGAEFKGEIPFSVDNLKNEFWLTFYENKSRRVISEISLDNFYKEVSSKTRKQNEKLLKKKKDFYKDYNPFVD